MTAAFCVRRRSSASAIGHATGTARRLHLLKELIEADKVKPVIDKAYPLSDAAEAIRHWEKGHARGKVVITV